MQELIDLMRTLRDPQVGCPWDQVQTFQTIAPYTIEEAYEVADAITRGDLPDLVDELGDLLFQVVFHAQMASEIDAFDFGDVVQAVVGKMRRRHPHVFDDAAQRAEQVESFAASDPSHRADEQDSHEGASSTEPGNIGSHESPATRASVERAWDQIKSAERAEKYGTQQDQSVLDDVTVGLPTLQRAQKLQKRAARAGFDWPSWHGVVEKLHEEITELEEEVALRTPTNPNERRLADELGDVLFTCVNLARHFEFDADRALREANQRFSERFRELERAVRADGLAITDYDLGALEVRWQRAKKAVKDGH
ncbi:MAG: ATP diphosphatase [Gammaproteobacteria bacterium]|jgi:ATP diphosphatase